MNNLAMQTNGDVRVGLNALHVYPVKSCAGVALESSVLIETGLEFDRTWMVVDAHGGFVTQRQLPRMVLVRPQLKTFEMVLRAPGMLALHVALDTVERPVRVRVWDDEVAAFDMGDLCAQWFSDFLGRPLRMVRFGPGSPGFLGAELLRAGVLRARSATPRLPRQGRAAPARTVLASVCHGSKPCRSLRPGSRPVRLTWQGVSKSAMRPPNPAPRIGDGSQCLGLAS